jgi:YVTN family beta-propeller protein
MTWKWKVLVCGLAVCLLPGAAVADVLLVANNGENSVTLLDSETYAVLATLPTGEGPHEIAVAPDGGFAYVADSGSPEKPGHTVTVLDLKRRSVAGKFDLRPHSPHDLKVSSDGRRLWAACAPTQSVLEIDTHNGKIVRAWKTGVEGGWMLTASGDDKRLYIAHLEGGAVTLIDRDSGSIRVVRTAKGEMGFAVSPDGRWLWAANVETGKISVLHATSGEIVTTLSSGGEGPVRLKFTPDGKLVLVPLGDKRLMVFDSETRKVAGEVPLEFRPKVIAVSGDSRWAFLGHPSENRLSVVDLKERRVIRTIETGKRPDGIAWSL